MKDQKFFVGNREHLHVLVDAIHSKDISRWNRWRASHNGAINLSGANLKATDVSGAVFDGCCLDRAWFYDAQMRGCSLRKASLVGSYFSKAILDGADFSGANLSHSDFEKCSCNRATFAAARAANVTFAAIEAREADFSSCKLTGTDFRFSRLEKSDFSSSKLTAASFREAKISECSFTNSDLRRSVWVKASVHKSKFTGCQIWAWTVEAWHLEHTICRYVFDDEAGSRRMPEQPRDGQFESEFRSDEFERIYRYMPTIRLVFERGFQIFDIILANEIVEHLKQTEPALGIAIRSIDNKGIYPEILFGFSNEADRDEVSERVVERYRSEIRRLTEINSRLKTENERLANTNVSLLRFLDARLNTPSLISVVGNSGGVAIQIGSPGAAIDFLGAKQEVEKAVANSTLSAKVGAKIKQLLTDLEKEGAKEAAKFVIKKLYAIAKEHAHLLPRLTEQLTKNLGDS